MHPAEPGETGDPYLSLHHTAIFISDHESSLRFYVEQLGFTVVFDSGGEGHARFVAVAPPDGTALLALLVPKAGSEGAKLIGRSGDVVFVTDNLAAKMGHWQERGVAFRELPQAQAWGGTVVKFQDPDGNSFFLVASDGMSRKIESQRLALAAEREAQRRAASEMAIAKQIQAKLFPQAKPVAGSLEYSGLCLQARAVGGDYYDFLTLGPGQIGLIVGDISGKGIGAALLMANLQANIRSQSAVASEHPQQFLRRVNELFLNNTPGSAYATLFFAVYEDATRRLRYANCGHVCGLLLRSDGRLEQLESTGTVVGLFNGWDCEVREVALLRGDLLVLYTDGVTEAFDDAGEEFGLERLVSAVRRNCHLNTEDLVAEVVGEVSRFSPGEQSDDITLIAAKCGDGV